jgi:protein SCO1/2
MLRGRMLRLTLLAVLAAIAAFPGPARAAGWGKDYIPNVDVVTQHGKTVKFYDELIKDKIFVINFLYTTCRDLCPLSASRLTQLQEALGDSMGRDIFFYSLSIDPETDTPERLKQYAESFQAGPGWLFLTGTRENIDAIRYKLGERSKILSDHRNEVLLGNGKTSEWARNNVLGDINALALTVRSMDPAWRPKELGSVKPPEALTFDFASRPGYALYKRLCAGCHTIGGGDRVGPDLDGVTERRDRDWLINFISDPLKMRRQNDPVALALAAKFPNVRMPPLGLADHDAADLLAYIAAGQSRPSFSLQPLAALTTHHGKRFSLEQIKGQPTAVVFGFTHCPDVCPTTLLDWSNVLESLGREGDRLKVLFVSVDTERDTPEALKAYMASFDSRITALTGTAAEVTAVARAFDAFYEKVPDASGGFTYDHTIKTYFIDGHGHRAGSVDLKTTEDDRRKAIAELFKQ